MVRWLELAIAIVIVLVALYFMLPGIMENFEDPYNACAKACPLCQNQTNNESIQDQCFECIHDCLNNP
jgi:hypothetical protein